MILPVLLYYRFTGTSGLVREVVLSDQCTARIKTLQPLCDYLQAHSTAVTVAGFVHHPIPKEFEQSQPPLGHGG